MAVNGPDHYTYLVGLGTLYLAARLTSDEGDDERRKKKRRVIREKADLLKATFPDQVGKAFDTRQLTSTPALRLLQAEEWKEDAAKTFLIDLAFTHPFAPYELKYKQDDFWDTLKNLAPSLGQPTSEVDAIREIQKDAIRSHRSLDLKKIMIFGVVGLLVVGTGGYLAAPLIAGYLGASAGLAGAAATAHGLALLGGGTLAAGGAGMAGGMAVVTGAGAFAGFAAASGGTLLMQMGAAQARTELIKLQVSYKAVLLQNQLHLKKAQEVVKDLARQEKEVRAQLARERQMNDKNAVRIKELEVLIEAIEESRKWMKEQS